MSTGKPPFAGEPTNIAALVSIIAGGLSLIVLPILLAPVAVITGVVGDQQGRRDNRGGRGMASLGIVLGLLGLVVMVFLSMRASNTVSLY